jgi:hypothetical protein
MKKIKLTQQDIDNNPLLKKIGAKAGQTMEYSFVSSGKAKTNEQSESNEGDEDDGGIEVPKKPPPPQP